MYVFGIVVEEWIKEFTFVSEYEELPRHVLLIAKQPPERLKPFDDVEVAVFAPVKLRYVPCIPAPNVEVALPSMVVVAPPYEPMYAPLNDENCVVEA